jgi:hypothetical protein
MQREDQTDLLLLVALWAIGSYSGPGIKSIERGGARIYEMLHPDEKEHADDLPGRHWTRDELVDLASRAGFADPRVAAAIALAESGGYEGIRGDNGDSWGLWQIDMKYHKSRSKAVLRTAAENAAAAYEISHGGKNWSFWSTWWKDAKHRIGPGEGPFRKYL